ncbi:MAG: hypothetical protein AAFP15_18355, partial [Bacteroidota bacterium]
SGFMGAKLKTSAAICGDTDDSTSPRGGLCRTATVQTSAHRRDNAHAREEEAEAPHVRLKPGAEVVQIKLDL